MSSEINDVAATIGAIARAVCSILLAVRACAKWFQPRARHAPNGFVIRKPLNPSIPSGFPHRSSFPTMGTPKPSRPSRPIKQHWTPRLYLRPFATPESAGRVDPLVWCFANGQRTTDRDDPFPVSIANVAAERFLYTPIGPDGRRDYEVDDRLTALESTVAPVWSALASDGVDLADAPVRRILALFVATLWLRHPVMRERQRELHRQLVTYFEGMERLPSHSGMHGIVVGDRVVPVTDSDFEAYRDADDATIQRWFVKSIVENGRRVAELLVGKRWTVLEAEEPIFITSDAPVCLSHPDHCAPRETPRRFGFGTPGTVITLPVSPTRLLLMTDRDTNPDGFVYPARPGLAVATNAFVWSESYRFMFSSRPTDEVLAEMVRYDDAERAR